MIGTTVEHKGKMYYIRITFNSKSTCPLDFLFDSCCPFHLRTDLGSLDSYVDITWSKNVCPMRVMKDFVQGLPVLIRQKMCCVRVDFFKSRLVEEHFLFDKQVKPIMSASISSFKNFFFSRYALLSFPFLMFYS